MKVTSAEKYCRCLLWCGAIALVGANVAQAEMIGINLTGAQLQYTTTANRLNDLTDDDGGNKNPDEAVRLSGSEFTFDGNLVQQYSVSMGESTYLDLLVSDITPDLTLPANVLVPSVATGDTNGGFGLSWFYDDGGTVRSLDLVFEEVTVALFRNSGNANRPILVVTGSTTDWTQSALPAGLSFTPGSAISFSYTTSNTMPFDITGSSFTTLLASGGVLELSGEGSVIPEPAAAALLLGGMMGFAGYLRLRWK